MQAARAEPSSDASSALIADILAELEKVEVLLVVAREEAPTLRYRAQASGAGPSSAPGPSGSKQPPHWVAPQPTSRNRKAPASPAGPEFWQDARTETTPPKAGPPRGAAGKAPAGSRGGNPAGGPRAHAPAGDHGASSSGPRPPKQPAPRGGAGYKAAKPPPSRQQAPNTGSRRRDRQAAGSSDVVRNLFRSAPPAPVATTAVDGVSQRFEVTSLELESELANWAEQMVGLGKAGSLESLTLLTPRLPHGFAPETLNFGALHRFPEHRIDRSRSVEPVAEPLRRLVGELIDKGVLPLAMRPVSVTVHVYEDGCWLPPHSDAGNGEEAGAAPAFPVCVVALHANACVNLHLPADGAEPGTLGASSQLVVPRRSCLVIDGSMARTLVRSVPPAAERGVTITIRKLPPAPNGRQIVM